MIKAYLSAKEVAAQLRLSTSGVYKLANAGKIPCAFINIGRRKKIIRFPETELDSWLKERQIKVRS